MRKKIVIGLGATTAVIALSTGISGALAASVGHEQAHAATAAAHKKITKAEARQIAKAKVPHSHVIEIESDDRHDRAVWKVTLATPHGRVIVDVDKKTGKATIVHHGDGGHGDGVRAMALGAHRSAGRDSARDAREDRGEHRRDDRGDRRDHDGRHHRGDRHDHDGADG
jgi:hypothetical protein